MAILELPPFKWELQKVTNIDSSEGVLGDGYTLKGATPYSRREDFILTFPGLTDYQYVELWGLIKSYSGVDTFEWRPFIWLEYKTYIFTEPKATNQGVNVWEISVTLKEIAPAPLGVIDPLSLITLITTSLCAKLVLTVRWRVPTTPNPNPPYEITVVQVNAPFEFIFIQDTSVGLRVRFPTCNPNDPEQMTTATIMYIGLAGLPGKDGVLDYELLSVEPL